MLYSILAFGLFMGKGGGGFDGYGLSALEYPVKMKKSSNISVTALHRFIPQPASGRSSALPYWLHF